VYVKHACAATTKLRNKNNHTPSHADDNMEKKKRGACMDAQHMVWRKLEQQIIIKI
jgi:hypothetical protein